MNELHELSIKLLGDLDECIEMSGEIGGNSGVPQVGVIFEDLAEVKYNLELLLLSLLELLFKCLVFFLVFFFNFTAEHSDCYDYMRNLECNLEHR